MRNNIEPPPKPRASFLERGAFSVWLHLLDKAGLAPETKSPVASVQNGAEVTEARWGQECFRAALIAGE
jgi:hypothetical protein